MKNQNVSRSLGIAIALYTLTCFPPFGGTKAGCQNIGINSTGALPDASSMLDVSSDSKGLLIPRVSLTSTTDAATIASPATSLLVYNTNAAMTGGSVGYWYWDGAQWAQLGAGGGGGTAWELLGNAGTVDGTNFLGTTDNVPLNFRVNNLKAGRVDATLRNAFLGYQAGNVTTGSDNVFMGHQSGFSNTTGLWNTVIGSSALYSNTGGSYNVAIGIEALYTNTTGERNTAIGMYSLQKNTTGKWNAATGIEALRWNTTGWYNTASGYAALYSNTTASENTAIGNQTLYFNTTGTNNTANGSFALYSNTTGSNNTALGNTAIFSNVTGWSNTAAGKNALRNSTGSWNTAMGDSAGYANTSGTLNTYLGYQANGSATLTNASAIGANASVTTSNSLVLGNAANVGIGTTSPTLTKLQVVGNTASADRADQFSITGLTNPNLRLRIGIMTAAATPYADIGFVEEAVAWRNIVFAQNGGNVGIGTPAPGQKLHVSTGYSLLNDVASTVNRNYGPVLWTDKGFGMELGYKTQWGTRIYTRAAAENISFGWQAGASTLQSQYTEWMRILNGNVGIGTTAPGNRLHVVVDDAATNTVTDMLQLVHTTTGAAAAGFGAGIYFNLDNSASALPAGTTGAARISAQWANATNNAEVGELRFGCFNQVMSGAVVDKLILRGDPASAFGGTYTSELILRATTDLAAPTDVVKIRGELTNPASPASAMTFWTRTGGGALTSRMTIDAAGNVGIGVCAPTVPLHVAGAIRSTVVINTAALACSDMHYKKNIIPLSNSLDKVLQMQGVNYYWKKEEFPDWGFNDKKQIGIIAQEAEGIFPELVYTDSSGYKMVDYPKITPILIEAIKEQQKKIDSQQAAIGSLQCEIQKTKTEQQKEISELKAMVEKLTRQNTETSEKR